MNRSIAWRLALAIAMTCAPLRDTAGEIVGGQPIAQHLHRIRVMFAKTAQLAHVGVELAADSAYAFPDIKVGKGRQYSGRRALVD